MSRYSPLPGLLLGLVLPLLGAVLVWVLLFRGYAFSEYVHLLRYDPYIASKVLSLAVLPNGLALMLLNRRRLHGPVRGLMVVTGLWVVLFVLERFVWQ